MAVLPRTGPNDETEQSDDDVDGRSSCGRASVTQSAERCCRRYHGDETAVAVTTRSGSGRMIVPDPNVVGFVLGLSPPPPPLPALLPRCSLPRQGGGGACLVSAVGGGRIYGIYVYIYYKCIFSRFVFVVFLQPIDRAAAARPSPTVADGCRTPRDPATIVAAYCFNTRPPHQGARGSL